MLMAFWLIASLCACETDVTLGTWPSPCDGIACAEPCAGPTGEEVCNELGECTLESASCEAACEGLWCGDACPTPDGGMGFCTEHGKCTTELVACPCLGMPCGSPCNDCADEPCVLDKELRYCHESGRCLKTRPACLDGSCGSDGLSCAAEEYCCNDSCGTCSGLGAYCDSWPCSGQT